MAIVIRLQNLPWAGNSVDIRRYFSGLSIPEGGVHIVGGENGDAFIAFSTDEDARQAMERDGGKIKDMKVKLLLSSRTEMAKVIEMARSQNLALQTPAAIKAAASDSDRRKVRSPSPPRRRDKEKTPPGLRDRDRERRRSSGKRDRSRSRSPVRSRGRDRDSERRSERSTSRRDDSKRSESTSSQKEKDDRARATRDLPGARESQTEDRKPYRGNLPNTTQGADAQSKTFDARLASSPPNFVPGQMEAGRMGMQAVEQRSAHASSGIAGIFANLPKFDYSSAPTPAVTTMGNDAAHLPSYTTGSGFPAAFDARAFTSSSTTGNYQAKRPSPTPGTSAPKLESSSSYAKGAYVQSDLPASFNNNFGNLPKIGLPSYNSSHMTGSRAYPAAPTENRVSLNQPIYGAEPHVRYDQVPEPNQAGRSASASRPRESFDSDQFSKKSSPQTSTAPASKPRRSRFEPEIALHQEVNQYSTANIPDNKSRPFPGPTNNRSNISDNIAQRPRDSTNDNVWPKSSTGSLHGLWSEGRTGLLAAPTSSRNEDFNQVVPMELEEDEEDPKHVMQNLNHHKEPLAMGPGPVRSHPHDSKANFRRGPPMTNSTEAPRMMNERNNLHRNLPRGPLPLTVEIRGLPFDAEEQDVVEFFRGILIPPTNLKLQRDKHGDPNGCAFVKFIKPTDCQEALSRHKRTIRNHPITIQVCPPPVYDNAPISTPPPRNDKMPCLSGTQSNLRPCENDLCVLMRGLPFSCREEDVVHFLDGLGMLDIYMEHGPDGHSTGVAHVEFGTLADFHVALDMNGKSMGRRQINITTSSKRIMDTAKGLLHGPASKKPLFPLRPPCESDMNSPRPLNDQQRQPMPDGPTFCAALRGLPKMVKNRDIAHFFEEINIIPLAIHIMLDPNKLPAGEAFVEFVDARQLDVALERNGKFLAGTRVSVVPIPHSEMVDILGGPPGPLLGNHPRKLHEEDCNMPRRPIMDDSMHPEHMPRGRGGPPRDRPPQFDHPDRPLDPRLPFNKMRGPMRPPGFQDGPRGVPSGFHPRYPGPPRHMHPPQDNEPVNFGHPGTVVGIQNLHFHAGLDEILEFFGDFDVDKDSVIRKYSETGQTMGEARVSFKSCEDAARAVQMLNKKPIFGRPLMLSLV